MTRTADHLPDDPALLKAMLLEQQQAHEQEVARLRTVSEQEIARLREQIHLLLHKRFGTSSEKHSTDQLGLFNEAELGAADDTLADAVDSAEAEIQVPARSRKKRGRQPLPDWLPRVRIEHDLPEHEQHCACCGNTALHRIGEEVSEQLDIIPAQVQVLQHVRPKYACRQCETGIRTVPMPLQPIPGSIASPALLAHIAVSKYQDALPLHRLETILQRAGIELPRSTLALWMVRVGQLIQPLINLLRDRLLAAPLIHCDETTVQVLKEPGKAATSESYMWVQVAGATGEKVVLFDYAPSRSGSVPERLLAGYEGYLQTDGYEGYAAIGRAPGVTHLGCWAHARRKFDEAIKGQGKTKKGAPAKSGKAQAGLAYIQNLYAIERRIAEQPPDERHCVRQTESLPILQALRDWLDTSLPQVPPKTLLGKALSYLHNQWPRLIRYCEAGHLRMDNNPAENAIRPFVVGRKNWLFSQSQAGARASAHLYSLIETAKANGLEPFTYLKTVLSQLPAASSVKAMEALLPWNASAN